MYRGMPKCSKMGILGGGGRISKTGRGVILKGMGMAEGGGALRERTWFVRAFLPLCRGTGISGANFEERTILSA